MLPFEVMRMRNAGPPPVPGFVSDANTLLLLKMEGDDGSTSFTDSSSYARTISAVGSAQIDTASAKIGSSSVLLDANGDYLEVPYSTDWQFGTNEFTVECFAQRLGAKSTWGLAGRFGSTRWDFYYASSNLRFRYRIGGTTHELSNASFVMPSLGVWAHWAVDRDASGVIRMYLNGNVLPNTDTNAGSISGGTGTLWIGAVDSSSYFNGRLDEVRISNVCRYGGSFTPIS